MAKRLTVAVTGAVPLDKLMALGDVIEIIPPRAGKGSMSEAELMEVLPRCDAVLACGAMTRAMIESAPRLRLIVNYGAGYDRVDVAAADEAGVVVTNLPDSVTESTAELAFALMLAVRRRVCELDRRVRTDPRQAFGMGRVMGRNLMGSTLGLVGMGRIGGRMGEMARAMGMKTVYYNRRPVDGAEATYMPLDALMAASDVVSIHCPLTEATRGLIGREQIARMKRDAALINTARGAIVDHDALIEALKSGQIGGAGLDVFPDEPHVPEGLLTLENVVLTPHVGTNTPEARNLMSEHAAQHIADLLCGRTPPTVVGRVRVIRDA